MNELTEKRITAIVVDDEVLGRDLVRHMAQAHRDLEIVADCGSVKRALEMINRLRPQLVFLDVEMPRANGFRLIEALPEETRPWVIFTTAYGQHAVKAFEADALDYLQKPFDQERFDLAIDRVRDQRRLAVEAALGRRVRDLIEPARSKGGGGTESAPNFTDRITINLDSAVEVAGKGARR